MIVIYVEQSTGEIKFWKEAGPADIALRPPPPGQVVVRTDRMPNYPDEGYVRGISRKPELDVPGVPFEMHEAVIEQRRAAVRDREG